MKIKRVILADSVLRTAIRLFILCCLSVLYSGAVFAAEGETFEGPLNKGDYIASDISAKNLSETDGAVVNLIPVCIPRGYKLRFECGDGVFLDGQKGIIKDVIYNDGSKIFNGDKNNPGLMPNLNYISVPDKPNREGYDFVGWYLKGNRPPNFNPTDADGEIIGEKCRYNIANDDEADLKLTNHGSDNIPIAKALWRINSANSQGIDDGNGPDKMESGQENEHTGGWDELNYYNQVIEYIEAYPSKDKYREHFGETAYSYRRLILNAETEAATEYKWFIKKKDMKDFQEIGHEAAAYKADKLTRADNGNIYRCEVKIGRGGSKLVYEMPLKVWYLPEITDTEIYIDGQKEEAVI